MAEKVEQVCGTELSGNKKPSSSKKYRNWCLTLWSESAAERLKKMNYKYIIIGNEVCPETKKKHFQCFIVLKSAVSEASMFKKFYNHYAKRCKGNAISNYNYCSKEGNLYFEDGLKPYERLTSKELKEMSVKDIIDFDARCSQAYIRAKNLIDADLKVSDFRKVIEVFYIYGPSGSGKTNKALDIIGERTFNSIKYENGFYSGIGSADVALYDDWRDSHMRTSEFINLIDYNIHNLNIKGGGTPNKYTTIIITSVQDPNNIYKGVDDEPRKQWLRRIKIIKTNGD